MFTVLVPTAFLALYLARGFIVAPFLKAYVTRAVSEHLGPTLEIGDLAGTYLTSIEFRKVRTTVEGRTSPLVALQVDRLEATYSLLEIPHGRDAFLRKLRIEVEGARLKLDVTQPARSAQRSPGIALPEVLPGVMVSESSIDLKGTGFSAGVQGLSVDVEGIGPTRIVISAQQAGLTHPSLTLEPSSVEVSLEYSPEKITLRSLQANRSPIVRSASLENDEPQKALTFTADLTVFGGAVSLSGGRKDGRLDFSLSAEAVDLAEAAALTNRGDVLPTGILSLRTAGSTASSELQGFEGNLSFSLENGTFRGRSFAEVAGSGSMREDTLTVETLRGQTATSDLAFTDAVIPLAVLREGRWRDLLHEATAAATLDSTDLPSFLALWGVAVPAAEREYLPNHHVSLAGSLEGGTLRLSSAALEAASGRLRSEGITVAFPAPEESWAVTGITGDADLAVEDLAAFSSLLPLPALRGSVTGRVLLDGTVAAPAGTAEADARDVFLGERYLGDLSFELEANRESIFIKSAELRQGAENRIGLSGVKLPAQALRSEGPRGVVSSLRGAADAELQNVPLLLESFGAAETIGEHDVPAHLLSAHASLESGRISLTGGSLTTPDGFVELGRAVLTLAEDPRSFLESNVDAEMNVRLPDLEVLAKVLGLPAVKGSSSGLVTLTGPLNNIGGKADLSAQALQLEEVRLGDASLKAAASGGIVTVEEFTLANGSDTLRASGSFDISAASLDDAAVELSAEEIAGYITKLVPEAWLPRGMLQASLSASGPVKNPRVIVELSLSGGAVGSIPVETAEAFVTGDGVTYRIEKLRAVTGLGSLDLPGPSTVTLEEGAASLARTNIDLPPGSMAISGTYGPKDKIDLFVQGRGLTSRGWLERYAGDRITFDGADASMSVTGYLSSPLLEASVSVAELRGGTDAPPLVAALQGSYRDGMLHLRSLQLQGETGSLAVRGRVPLLPATGEQPVDLLLEVDLREVASLSFAFPPDLVPQGSLQGEIRAGGKISDPEFLVSLKAENLFLPDGLAGAPPGPLSLGVLLSGNGDRITLEDLSVSSRHFSAEGAGTWSDPPGIEQVIAGEEKPLKGTVSFQGRFSAPDIFWAAELLARVRHLGGSLAGEVSATGPLDRPAVDASLKLRDVEASLSGMPLLSSLSGTATFREDRLSFEGVEGHIGGAPAALKGGILFQDGWKPVFDLALGGEGLLLYRSSGTRIRADSNLTASGPLDALAVGGTIRIVDSGFTRDFDFLSAVSGEKKPPSPREGLLFSFRDPPLRDMTFDVRVETAEAFIVRNQHVKGSLQPDVRLRGTGELPYLDGVVILDPSRIVLPAGILRTEKGRILFSAEEPDRIGLDVKGSTRILGYDITVAIGGFTDDPRILLTSVPPLPNDELLLLVLLGTPPASGDVRTAGVSGSALAFFLGRGYLSRIFGSEDETLDMVLERFETAVGRDITERGRPTIESTLRLGEGVVREGDTLYLTGERDRFDEINYGVRILFEFGGEKEDE